MSPTGTPAAVARIHDLGVRPKSPAINSPSVFCWMGLLLFVPPRLDAAAQDRRDRAPRSPHPWAIGLPVDSILARPRNAYFHDWIRP